MSLKHIREMAVCAQINAEDFIEKRPEYADNIYIKTVMEMLHNCIAEASLELYRQNKKEKA